MPNRERATCKACSRHKSVCGPISWAGYCGICGPLIYNANSDQLHEGDGPFYEHWNNRTLLAAHRRRLAYTKGT